MLTERELEQVEVLLSNSNTPNAIKQVLQFTLKCQEGTLTTANRLVYLESITRQVIEAPADKLELMSYMPVACPGVPTLISTEDLTIEPPPEIKEDLYKAAIDSGLHLLTPMEAEAMLQGIQIGIRHSDKRYENFKDTVGYVIHMIAIGQRIRTVHQQ